MEFQKVRELYVEGLVQQVWLRGDAGGACMIVEAASVDEVAEKLNTASRPGGFPAASHDRAAKALLGFRPSAPIAISRQIRKAAKISKGGFSSRSSLPVATPRSLFVIRVGRP